MISILIVDDDPHIRELLRLYLRKEGYQLLEAKDGQEALDVLEVKSVQLAIVDIMMPHIDGYELCAKIRKYYDLPVLMLTAKVEVSDKEKAYTVGTDDYVVKPFEPKEVLFRVRALLRSYQMVNQEEIQIGKTMIDRKSYTVFTGGKTKNIPLKEYE